MTEFSDALSVSASGMRAQATRLRYTSENIANTETPGYRRKTTSFEAMVTNGERSGAVQVGPVTLDQTALDQVFDPAHPMADAQGYHQGSNVDLLVEIADAREAQRSYEANLKMFDQSRKMSSSLMELLRR